MLCRTRFALSLTPALLFTGVCLAAQVPTTTVLGLSASSVPAGTAVTLTGIVLSNNLPVSPGLVTFQDGKAVIGSAQIVPAAGSASIKVRLGLGAHQLTAIFAGTNAAAKSTSQPEPFTVTGTVPTTTAITSSGSPGNYTLTGTVSSSGVPAPTGTVSFLDQTNNNQLGSAALGGSTTAQTFQPQQTYAAGPGPNSVAVGDFNGDGIPDLAAVSVNPLDFLDSTVSVLLGKGDGTFQPLQAYATGLDPGFVAVGDFNGDGIPDLATANRGDNTVSVLLGNGDGTFQAQQTYPVGIVPQSVAVGDFNGDGIADLAASNGGDNTVSVLLGNGDGTFQAQQTYPVGLVPQSVAVGDFNEDGILDLATANIGDQTVSVLLGNGNGTFQAQQTYAAGLSPYALAVADFNGDGVPDLAVANMGDQTVSVLLGNGNGTFQAQQTYPVGNSPQSVAAGDFNGDGIPDLAAGNNVGGTVSVLFGKADGTFQPQQTYTVGGSPTSVAVGDFNGDGIPDLVAAQGAVSVLLNSVTQSATATLSNVAVVGTGTHQVATSYGGDSFHQASTSSSIGLTAASQITTSLSLNASASTSAAGQPVTLRAALNVYASGSFTTNGEMVTFYNGSTSIGTAALSNGQATLTTTALPVGPDTITAQYAGDQNFTASTSNSVTVTVTPAPNFTITANPPTETTRRGDVAAFILQLKSVNGFDANVTLSCSGGPAGSKCADFPQTVHVNGTAYAVSGILFPKNTTPATYTLTFTGVSGALTNSTTAKFTVK